MRKPIRNLVPIPILFLCACQAPDEGATTGTLVSADTVPPLAGSGPPADRAAAFLRWAAASRPEDAPALRAQLAGARRDQALIDALAGHAQDDADHGKALLAVALVGAMQSPGAEGHLRRVVARPLPAAATGEHDARAGLEMLQAKAVDGLAHLGRPSADAEVLRIAASHDSRVVRAEAIEAFLYQRGGSDAARSQLLAVIRPEDHVFLDRPRHVAGASAAEFDGQLARYLAAHPELVPPKPVKREGSP